MKKKYLVTSIFVILLAVTVFLMIRVEDKLRQEKIIVIDSTRVEVEFLEEYEPEKLQYAALSSKVDFRSKGEFFEVLINDKNHPDGQRWEEVFLKGINLGVALPGKFPSEFPQDFETYSNWIKEIGDMNSNVIRTYTILPPQFYEALADYNLIYSDKPVYLMQGVWATVPDDHDYYNEEYTYVFQKEIRDVIDVLHGNAYLEPVRGKASGTFVANVSSHTIAILLGREWEPKGVTHTNMTNTDTSYDGEFVSIPDGTAMETWLGRMMDFTFRYETMTYSNQHPVSFVNWLPLDPMFHNSEYIENEKVREYDNDLEYIDFSNFHFTGLNKAGIYAAYHAYPYYPDFIYLDEKYNNKDEDTYFLYLQDLKTYCQGMPLVIAEYGVPSSRGNSHYTHFGFDQGGHNEKEQAEINKTITEDINETGCAGAIMFEWLDEWFKFNWMVMDFEQPQHRRKYWHNKENPEQNFGIVAVENLGRIIDGETNDWEESSKPVEAFADPSYFYMKYELKDFDFDNNNLFIAIDTYDKSKGDHRIPFVNRDSKRGIEFILNFASRDSARIQVDDYYSVFSDIYNDYIPVYTSRDNDNGKFVDQELISNRERYTLLGERHRQKLHNRSKLHHGKWEDNSNTDWYYNEESGVLELRLAWHLLNVSDPSTGRVLDDKEGTGDIETRVTEGFHIYSYITDKNGKVMDALPEKGELIYKWKGWDEPVYQTRMKQQYYTLQDLFKKLVPHNPFKKQEESTNSFEVCRWFEGKPGAISITFDDGSYGQYEYAFPVLEKYKLKGDFGVVGQWTFEEPRSAAEEGVFSIKRMGWNEIRELRNAGHEISSHGFLHQKMDETLPEEELIFQLQKNRTLILENAGVDVKTIHYPYSHYNKAIMKAAEKAGFLFGRGETSQGSRTNLMGLPALAIINNDMPSCRFIQNKIEEQRDDWLVMMYHHIFREDSKEMGLYKYHNVTNQYAVTPQIFDNQIRLLRNSGYWIAPTAKVGSYVKLRDNVKLEQQKIKDSYLITLRSDLDSNLYNHPLTLKFSTDWEIVKVSNSEADGIYNTRNGEILFPVRVNKNIIVERLK